METLGGALPKEITHVHDFLMPMDIEIGPPGQFALDAASKEMIATHQDLKGFEV